MKKTIGVFVLVIVLCGALIGIVSVVSDITSPQTTTLSIGTGVKGFDTLFLHLLQLDESNAETDFMTNIADEDGVVYFKDVPVQTKWKIDSWSGGFERVLGKMDSIEAEKSLIIELPKGVSHNRIGFLLKKIDD